ncbi:2030_t:CDS:2, partial [Cetraspora pellucida]
MFKLSIIGKITLISFILQAIILSTLEAFVVYFHLNFVKQYKLSDQAAEALWHRNTVQIIGLVIFNFLSLTYAGIQLYQHEILEDEGTERADYTPDSFFPISDRNAPKSYYEARMRPIEHTIIGLISGFSLYFPFLSYLLAKEFGWENYKTYSADIQLRDTHMSLTILQTLIKMDLFFIGSYALQLLPSRTIGYASYFWSITEVILVFFSGAVMLVMAWFSVTMEKKYLLNMKRGLYVLTVFGQAEKESNTVSPTSKRQGAIHQQQLRAKE